MGSATSNISPERDLLDLHGRVAIVTGANSGIGLYIALHLVRRGAKVYLAARSEEKAEHAIGRMEQEGMGEHKGELVWLPIDLTDPHKAKAAAEWFVKRESRLDILVNNAAKILSEYGRTADDISDSMVINHISPFLFTKTLLPVMKKTALEPGSDVRIVNVASIAHRWVPNPRYDSLEAFNNDFSTTYKPKTNVYAYTKLANVLWTAELQRRFDAEKTPITAMSVHPGNVMSEGNVKLFTSLAFGRLVNWGFSLFFISPHDGGYTPAWAAASRQVFEERDKYRGKYLVPYGVLEEASEDARREDLAKELWDTTEGILKDFNWL
ncbi:NAD-P-binding protein [Russula ochroleuca]|jgi:NAD(P)-dependent dehydrogenase (short-subunit alcohol dehydrogenase family)|uniref:NAD-P-binding protein n=1 Tax=Russula ochroleuca TaxID=152965 RepID=A0A9P5T8W0_9AGAM|nr:NAD-P-binding protein [Russula ochroleuca]